MAKCATTVPHARHWVGTNQDGDGYWCEGGDEPDMVNHPPHYNAHPTGTECIDIVEHMSFNIGNAIKYLWRQGLKGDEPTQKQDLEKAIWYINREIERSERVRSEPERSS